MYDISRRETFNRLTSWLPEIRQYSEDNIVVMLIGNKSDGTAQRVVTRQEGENFARANGLIFTETSASTADNVDYAFTKTGEEIYNRIKQGKIVIDNQEGIKVNPPIDSNKQASGGCPC